jgi:hypothetical protein
MLKRIFSIILVARGYDNRFKLHNPGYRFSFKSYCLTDCQID